MNKLFICIPTYNEKENIITVLKRIETVSNKIDDFEIQIIVIDDNSPDKTAQLVKDYAKTSSLKIHLIENLRKSGLGKAYIQAFNYARHSGAYAVCEMDADLSHNPKYLLKISKLITKYDLVIGSRYVENGGAINWGLKRQFISRCGNIYSRIILGINVHDLTGGYNCYRVTVFDKLDLRTVSSVGYAFQIEMKYRTIKLGFNWIETPIIFVDRVKGKSKLINSILLEAIFSPWKLRFKKFD